MEDCAEIACPRRRVRPGRRAMKIRLISIGKPRLGPAGAMTDEYAKRLGRYCRFETVAMKSQPAELPAAKCLNVVFDPRGRRLDSRGFAKLIEDAGRDVDFYIGGAEGFTERFRNSADRVIALSAMTFSHELARAAAAEQIYRAFTIMRGHPYPR